MAVGRTHDCSAYVPEESVRQWETGDILVGYDVGLDGVISNVHLLKTSGFDRLDTAALTCVRERWRNTPALENGQPVASPGHQAIVRFAMPDPVSAEDFYTRGFIEGARKDYQHALSDLTVAIKLASDAPNAYRARALVYEALGQNDLAAADRAKADALVAEETHGGPPGSAQRSDDGVTPTRPLGATHDCRYFYQLNQNLHLASGVVRIGYDIGADGGVSSARILTSSGSAALDQAALACVIDGWWNAPAMKNGVPVASPGHEAIISFSGR
jgi:TonB family protein